MNKPKAPKDRTVDEFIDLFEERYRGMDGCISINMLRKIASEPAPNPFTDDQLAWMRETQRCGFNYAAKEANGTVYFFEIAPTKRKSTWYDYADDCMSALPGNFLQSMLSWEDDEPLCFADYAPLPEGEPKEADHVQED